MIRRCASLLLAVAVWLMPAAGPKPAHASNESAGTFGAPFLDIPVGARALTLPNAVAGMRPDASLLFSNPAALAEMNRGGLFISTATWLDEFNFTAASLATPIRPAGLTVSLGTRMLYSGGLKGYNALSQVVDEESYYDMALTAGLSKRFGSLGLALGGDVTYLREHLPNGDGSGFTYSLGMSYRFGRNRFSVSAENIDGTISFPGREYKIRNRVVVGYGRVVTSRLGSLDLGAEVSASQSEYERFRVGGTYALNRYLSVSGGLDHNAANTSQVDLPFSAGLGVHFDRFAFDYAYTPQEYFSSTHTVSLGLAFGESESTGGPKPSQPGAAVPGRPVSDRGASSPVLPPTGGLPNSTPAEEPGPGSFAVVAGWHSRLESASAEVRALELLKVPAVIETNSRGSYRVLIARYDTLAKAQEAVKNFEKRGHRFTIISGSE